MTEYRFPHNDRFIQLTFSVIFALVITWKLPEAFNSENLWEALMLVGFAYLVAFIMIYGSIHPVKQVILHQDGKVIFQRLFRSHLVDVNDIIRISPHRFSRRDFVLEHSRGSEWLFNDPTMVAALAKALLSKNQLIVTIDLPPLPN